MVTIARELQVVVVRRVTDGVKGADQSRVEAVDSPSSGAPEEVWLYFENRSGR
jgi:hypothetical protein